MSDDRHLWPINGEQIYWDRLTLIPVKYRHGNDLYFHDRGAGYLGITDHRLVFQSTANHQDNFQLDLDAITYFSLVWWEDSMGTRPLLTAHDSSGEQWDIHAFELTLDRLHDFTNRLLRSKPDAPLAPYTDHGPKTARLYEQDIYGAWNRIMRSRVYIAPDRLLIAELTDLLFEQITKLTLINGDAYPMLRIDYRRPDDAQLYNIGLRFRGNDDITAWAYALRDRTGVELIHTEARKKKSDDD